MSHTVLANFKCNEGMGALLLPVLLEALADTRAFEGCESIETYVDQDNPDLILLWEKWDKRESHAAYIEWRIESGMLDDLAPILEIPLNFNHLSPQD